MPEQRPLIPFRFGSRQRFQDVGVIPFTGVNDAFSSNPFPRVGLMNKIYLQFRGTITTTGASAAADRGPWNLVKRMRGVVNQGSATIFDLSGYGAFLVESQLEGGSRPDRAGIGDTVPDADIHAFDLTGGAGAKTVVLTYILPIAANDNEQFSLGMLNLQAPQVQFTLEGNWGAFADFAATPGNVATITAANLYVGYMYWDVPNPMEVQLPPPMLVRTLEEEQPINTTGQNIYTLPRQGLLSQLTHIITLNAARSNSVDRFEFVVNNTDFIYRYQRQFMKFQQRFNNQSEWPVGVFKYDFWAAQAGVSNGDTRDMIDSEANALTESRIYITDSATLGAANNKLTTIRRIWQNLAM